MIDIFLRSFSFYPLTFLTKAFAKIFHFNNALK